MPNGAKQPMSFELVYELKQQTPIIHFQYDQKGAALRATEVKPKLDRYIIKYAEKMGLKYEDMPKSWKISLDKNIKALNYRMMIKSEKETEVDIGPYTPYDIFYGNTGRSEQIKAVESSDISMTIVCTVKDRDKKLNKRLLEFIDDIIEGFFITHNFGMMQRKGFGSYVVGAPSEETIARELMSEYEASNCYRFKAGSEPFRRIKLIYSIMKSGVNFGGYRRSLLFLYMHEKHKIGNEKAWLKQNAMAPATVGVHAKTSGYKWLSTVSPHTPHYVRALLGTGEKIEFLMSLQNRRMKSIVKIKNEQIERLQSPIIFKVINDMVFFVGEKVNNEIFNKSFEFRSDYSGVPKSKTLTVPGEFDINDFLEYCYIQLNYDSVQLNKKYTNAGYTALADFRQTNGLRIEKFIGGVWK